MSDRSRGLIDQGKPWSSEAKWPVIAIEAIILVAIGAFMLISTDQAGEWLLQIIGLVLLFASLQLAFDAIRPNGEGAVAFDAFRAGIGVTIGVIATSLWWSNFVSTDAVRLILGWGLVAFAVLQAVGFVIARRRSGMQLPTLAFAALTLVLGILLLTSNEATAEDRLQFLGVVLLVFGVLLAGLAYLIRSGAATKAESLE